jgi:hypothetical protein
MPPTVTVVEAILPVGNVVTRGIPGVEASTIRYPFTKLKL